ncbi:MAG: imelysin family protein [Pseudohongiellaceae bacterium]
MEMSFITLVTRHILQSACFRHLASSAVCLLVITSCNPNELEPEIAPSSENSSPIKATLTSKPPTLDLEAALLVRQLATEYLGQIDNDFGDLRNELSQLQTTINRLVSEPTAEMLRESQEKWLSAHLSFQQTKIHFNFLSRIGSPAQGDSLSELIYRIDHWPIMAGYIDSVEGYPRGGIVHDVNVNLDSESLTQQHGLFDATEATLGFHVLEFLLWGEPNVATTSRTAEHFVPLVELSSSQSQSGMEIEQLGNNRRRRFSTLLSTLLVEDFNTAANVREEVVTAFLSSIEDRHAVEILDKLLDAVTSTLNEEILTSSLYRLLNDDLDGALHSPYSRTSEKAVASQLLSIEKLLLETPTPNGITLDKILIELSPNFENFFYQNLDANKACLVLLYSNLGDNTQQSIQSDEEFQVVECINLLTKLVDQLEQIKLNLPLTSQAI